MFAAFRVFNRFVLNIQESHQHNQMYSFLIPAGNFTQSLSPGLDISHLEGKVIKSTKPPQTIRGVP